MINYYVDKQMLCFISIQITSMSEQKSCEQKTWGNAPIWWHAVEQKTKIQMICGSNVPTADQ